MNKLIYVFLLIIIIPVVYSYNNIYEFDMNEDMILSTTVYNVTGHKCLDCTCNLTVYNPHPNENYINLSIYLDNKGNGIYSINLLRNLTYNKNIYPITIVCNDSNGCFGGESREGIKVGETLFDYTAGVLAILVVGFGLLFMSFKIDKSYEGIKKLTFFGSIPFLFLSLFAGYTIILNSPNNAGMKVVFISAISALLMIVLGIIYLYFYNILKNTYSRIGRT